MALDLLRRKAIAVPESGRVLTISSPGDRGLGEALGVERAASGDEADLVLIAGSHADRVPLGEYRNLLAPAASRGVPCVRVNPDRFMLTPTGRHFGAGRIAELYRELGGAVTYVGKPHPEIYVHALRLAGLDRSARIVCFGDSVEHDILGAKRFGAMAILVRTGVNAALGEAELEEEFRAQGATPDMIMPAFAW